MTVRARPGPILPLVLSMVSLCVGTSYAKTLFSVAGAAGVTALRIGISALLLVGLQRPWRWEVTPVQARAVIAYGLVLACMNLAFYQSLRTLPLGIAIAIEFLGPLGVAVGYSRRAVDLLWVALAAGGIALLVAPGAAGGVDASGAVFALVAALCWALYILTGKHASAVVPERWIVCLGLCAASVIAVPIGLGAAGAVILAPKVLAAGALIAVLCSALPYSLEMFALKRLPTGVFGVVLSLEPAIGAAAAFLLIRETLGPSAWAGMAAVMAASAGSALTASPPASSATEAAN